MPFLMATDFLHSAMIHIPKAGEVFDESGEPRGGKKEAAEWVRYTSRCFAQLEWWGGAARAHKTIRDPFKVKLQAAPLFLFSCQFHFTLFFCW